MNTLIKKLKLMGTKYNYICDWAIEIEGEEKFALGNTYKNKVTDFKYIYTICIHDFIIGVKDKYALSIGLGEVINCDCFIKQSMRNLLDNKYLYELLESVPTISIDGTILYSDMLLLRCIDNINKASNKFNIIDNKGNKLKFNLGNNNRHEAFDVIEVLLSENKTGVGLMHLDGTITTLFRLDTECKIPVVAHPLCNNFRYIKSNIAD